MLRRQEREVKVSNSRSLQVIFFERRLSVRRGEYSPLCVLTPQPFDGLTQALQHGCELTSEGSKGLGS